MNPARLQCRRATIEDLPALKALWQSMNLPVPELERHLTEFQVAVDSNNTVIGAIGFQMAGKHGLIHSEGFTDFGAADTARPLLWERIQMLAANHGTVRAWTKEATQFWKRTLGKPDEASLAKLPPIWAAFPGDWLTLKLREDVEEVLSLDKEFEKFAVMSKMETQATLGRAKVFKTVALSAAVVLGVGVLIAIVMMFLHQKPPQPGH